MWLCVCLCALAALAAMTALVAAAALAAHHKGLRFVVSVVCGVSAPGAK